MIISFSLLSMMIFALVALMLFGYIAFYSMKNASNTTTTVLPRNNPPGNTSPSGVVFAPYLMPGNDFAQRFIAVGGKFITAAFINWNGNIYWDSGDPDRNMIAQLRSKGGDIVLSTGGYSGNRDNAEPALQGGTSQQIYQRYKAMVDSYKANYLDLDIEIGKESQADTYQKRNDALVLLQRDYPNLKLSYTLPCDPSGIGGSLGLIKDAAAKGLFIDCVRSMIFDFSGSGNYVNDIISGATNTFNQCKSAGLKFKSVGIILMVPVDDNKRPISVDEVRKVVQWIKGPGKNMVGYIGFWVLNTDPDLTYSKAIIQELG